MQVGLLIGRLGTARDYLLFVVKTPAQVRRRRLAPGQRLHFRTLPQFTVHAELCFSIFQDGTEPAVPMGSKIGGGGGKGAAASPDVQLDTEWIAEHAAQVTRMLPGGGRQSYSALLPQVVEQAACTRGVSHRTCHRSYWRPAGIPSHNLLPWLPEDAGTATVCADTSH